jgi:hypothetical protein
LGNFLDRLGELGKAGSSKGEETLFLRLLKSYGNSIAEKPIIAAYILGYFALSTLRYILGETGSGAEARSLAEHWNLDRKLREAFISLGAPEDEASGVTEIIKAVLARTSPDDLSLYGTPSLAESVILANYSDEDFKKVLGINYFEDVTWFNKEAFENVLFYAPLFLILESGDAFKGSGKAVPAVGRSGAKKAKSPEQDKKTTVSLSRVETIAALALQFARAEEQSAYRLDLLIEGLSGKSRSNTAGFTKKRKLQH